MVQPRISLAYSSAARTGTAGYGWNLHVSSIEQSPLSGNPVHAQDARFMRFVHDGAPLAFICQRSTCPAAAAAELANSFSDGGDFFYFRKQLEDGTPARFLLNEARDTWKVQVKGGLEQSFGGAESACEREPHSGDVVRWHLSGESDARNPDLGSRNRVVYRWTKAPGRRGHAFLEHVYFTEPTTGLAGDSDWAFHIELAWAQNALLPTSYGSPLRTAPDALLQAIGVSAMPFSSLGARLVQRIYRLDYTDPRSAQGYVSGGSTSPLFHEFFLRSVREEGSCRREESSGHIPFATACGTKPALTFQYEDGTTGPNGPNGLGSGATGLAHFTSGTFAQDRTALYSLGGASVVDLDRDGLPDIVQSWASGPTCEGWVGANGGQWKDLDGHGVTLNGDVLICNDTAPTFARPLMGYLNEGPDPQALRLRHQCMDAGNPADLSTLLGLATQPGTTVPTTFLTQQAGASLLGSWGNGQVAWQNADYGPMMPYRTRPSTGDQGDCHLPWRPFLSYDAQGNPQAPQTFPADYSATWVWKKAPLDWARPAVLGNVEPGWFVDVDGDGLVDLLERAAETNGDLGRAYVAYTTRYARGESLSVQELPAQVPFGVLDAGTLSVAPKAGARTESRFFYVDVNGDGLVDLVSQNENDHGGLPEARPGDGYGGFACDAAHQPFPCDSAGLTPHYRLSFPAAPRSPLPFTAETFFEDVTGDGLVDIVKLVEQPHDLGVSVPVEVWLWVNLDGKNFECAGFNGGGAPDCKIATLIDDVHVTFDTGPRRVTFADMDANGISDVVVLTKSGAHVVYVMPVSNASEIAHAPRPGLLTRIDDGRGSTTRARYRTIQALDIEARSSSRPWVHHSRAAGTVVTDITVDDAVVDDLGSKLPEPFGVQRGTSFTYRDPAYDRWERHTLGFRTVREQRRGEAAVTETTYWFSVCQNDSIDELNGTTVELRCNEGSSDEGDKWLVGRPLQIDHFVPEAPGRAQAIYLWSKRLGWQNTRQGAFELHPTWWRPQVVTESVQHFDTSFGVVVGGGGPPTGGGDPVQFPHVQGGSKTVVTSRMFDGEGTQVSVREEVLQDPASAMITTYAMSQPADPGTPGSIPCDQSYVCRATNVTLWALDRGDGYFHPRRETAFEFGSWAGPTVVKVAIHDGVGLERANPTGGAKSDGRLADIESVVPVPVATMTYDAFGNTTRVTGDPAPMEGDPVACTELTYDPLYAQFPTTVRRYVNGCNSSSLNTDSVYDRGTGIAVLRFEPNGGMHQTLLDGFGRPEQVWGPDPEVAFSLSLTAELLYHDAGPTPWVEARRPLPDGTQITTQLLFNGLGEPVMSLEGSTGYWIARSTAPNDSGAPSTSREAKETTLDAAGLSALAVQGQSLFAGLDRGATFAYDDFGRETLVTELASSGTYPKRSLAYSSVFEVTALDGEQLRSGSPRQGGYTRTKTDHRGRTTSVTRVGTGLPTVTEEFVRLATGEVTGYVRRVDGVTRYARSASYDTLGRMVSNTEPNVGTWRYTYTREGRLLGTQDARGCGVDYYYDGLGRTVGEDYSPCTSRQPAYSAPDLATGAGLEVKYAYDAYEAGQQAADATFADNAVFAAGALVAVQDRGSHTRMNRDARGRLRAMSRRLATPGAANAPSDPTFAAHWFATRTDYDVADRMTMRTTGADDGAFRVNGTSAETWTYDQFSRPQNVSTSYGLLFRGFDWAPDGAVTTIRYGDEASTKTTLTYDARRRLQTLVTSRTAPSFWSSGPLPTYSLPPAETAQTKLHDLSIVSYDEVGNPNEIRDTAGSLAPARGNPATSRVLGYDSFYRLTSVTAQYGTYANLQPDNRWRTPFSAEVTAGDRSPVPVRNAVTRLANQTFAYDGLGNITSSSDNLSMNWDRSLGTVTRGTSTDAPNRLLTANGITASYDAAGNVIELKVDRTGTCALGSESRCKQWFSYDWDEAGRLLRARRWDFTTSFPAVAPPSQTSERPVPSATPTRDVHYAYSLGQRVVRWAKDEVSVERATADVFPSLRLHRASYQASAGDYDAGPTVQRPRLGGVAEVHYDPSLPKRTASDLHMFIGLTDELGSSTVMIEHATGELAERVMYQAYGATEQDTRPTRWGSHREPLRFTGKEDDMEVGLSYFGARYYAPNLGQWASADPLTVHAFGADPNPYAYVAGRVATHVDPFGLDCEPQCKDGSRWVTLGPNNFEIEEAKDVQYNDREGQAAERMARMGRRALAIHNRAQRAASAFGVGLLHSVELTPIPGGPSLGGALEAAGAVGPSSEETAAKVVGQLIGLGVTFAVGAELNAAAAADLPAAASAVEDAATNAKGLVAGGRTYINSSRVVERAAAEPGPFHNFPGSFDQVILEQGEQKLTVAFFKQPKAGYGASGVQYTLPGTVNGQQGVFEIGTRLSTSGKVELIMHRFFRPTR